MELDWDGYRKEVYMMGGTISVQSKKHKGTTFTVDIPLKITDKEM